MKKYYIRDWGRPCGMEYKVFTDFDTANAPNTIKERYWSVSLIHSNNIVYPYIRIALDAIQKFLYNKFGLY